TEQMWRDISRQIEVDLDTFSASWGESAGDVQQQLGEINREKYDYGDFLKRFAALGENMEINDDEFDYIFYTYGLELYEKMPLIEPLEYKEVKKIREFVIALDTSESVAGELVQKFVTKTWNLLKQTENFFTKVNVHILQCGARVEEDAKITGQDEFDDYISKMVLRGFGGTDFRPVFEHVNKLIKLHEFQNFKGLIYFTDGYGTYPAMPPEYESAFVFLDQGREIPEVPVWAMRLILTEEEIEDINETRSF
ncbi:MAG: VWA-like domain-containing protein, partial [Bacillota bacterium]|nr:VWA-like domain-containing protein [Bacillota bacterium]